MNASTPTLSWPGKHSPPPPALSPVHLVEVFEPNNRLRVAQDTPHPEPPTIANSLFWGDNCAVLTHLLANGYRGQVKLIYIDPPYATGAKWGRKIRLRGPKAPTMQTSADHVFAQQTQYSDQWSDNDYLQFMYERLPLLRDLLSENGSLWLHVDHRQVHHMRMLLQEVFGADNYLNTIAWRSQVARGAKVNAFYFPFSTHYIEIFAKSRTAPTTWNLAKKQIILTETEAAREFMHDERGFFRTSDPGTYSFASLKVLHAAGRLYAPYGGELIIDEVAQRIYASKGGNLGVKYYLTNLGHGKWAVERAVDNFWDDIPGLGTTPGEDCGYPTQKTEALLERIIRTSTDPGDLVLDCFMGSGTTLAVAQRLGRQWIGCDNNRGAVLTTRRRLHASRLSGDRKPPGFAIYQTEAVSESLTPLPSMIQAQIEITRNPTDATLICVTIIDFVSPTIVAQLALTLVHQTNPAWRALVDCIAIDPAYDGQIFHSVLVDAPLKKRDQVLGFYTLPAPPVASCVAVRITDLLGEEVVVTKVV
ncbi:MAG: site-specific DNA-methyltransferase [Chloroflexi bacterium]|nr:site-specific DNA-methyltransferase [Chloroflexota bacterium]